MECPNRRSGSHKKHTLFYDLVYNDVLPEFVGLQKEKTTDPKTELIGVYIFSKITFEEK
jgi:hypothetical protein